MSIVSVFLPFTLLAFLAIILLSGYLMKKSFSVKITHWLLLIYTSVLFLATVIVLFGTDIETISLSRANEAQEKEISEASSEFSQAIENGKRPKVDSEYVMEEKSFTVDSSFLTIDSNWEHSPYVVVERIVNDQQSIKAQVYSFSYYTADGYDLTHMVTPPSVKQSENNLLISGPGFKKANLSVATKEFPIDQFKNDGQVLNNLGSSSMEHYVIYLKVPEDVEIKATDNVYIEYLQ